MQLAIDVASCVAASNDESYILSAWQATAVPDILVLGLRSCRSDILVLGLRSCRSDILVLGPRSCRSEILVIIGIVRVASMPKQRINDPNPILKK